MISLLLFKIYFIIIILRLIYYRYLKFILLLLFDLNSHKNRNSYFIKIYLLYARKFHYYNLMFIIHLIILLLLFDIYFNYLTLILLLLLDFNFHKNLNL